MSNHFFPNLSAVAKSYEPIFSILLNDSVPQSQLTLYHKSKTSRLRDEKSLDKNLVSM